MTVRRFDSSKLSKVRKTPSGGLRIDARLTRTGILEYRRADGSIQRELRLPEEVFNTDSLETLRDAPVTDLHPSEMVNPDNWQDVSIGHLSEMPRQDGIFVAGSLAIQSAKGVSKVERGDGKEISLGYTCKLEMSPGVYQGQRYDAIQREIRYNHIGLGPEGWGRAGSEVSLRLDAADAIAPVDDISAANKDTVRLMDEIEIKLDGVTVKVPKLAKELFDRELARLDTKAKDLETKLGKVEGDLATARKDLADASDPAKVQAKVDARVSLESSARSVLGEDERFDGKSARQIQESVVTKVFPDIKLDGRSDDFVSGLFESATKANRNDSLAAARVDAEGAPKTKKSAKTARDEMMERNRNAYKATASK